MRELPRVSWQSRIPPRPGCSRRPLASDPNRACRVCGRRVGGHENGRGRAPQRFYCSPACATAARRRRALGRPVATFTAVVVLNLSTRQLEWVWGNSPQERRVFPYGYLSGIPLQTAL